MTVYTGCRRCGHLITVTDIERQTCDGCPPVDPVLHLKDEIDAFMAGRSDGAAIDWLAAQAQRMEDSPPQFHAAARAYAAWGWPVFPCLEYGKQPATKHGLSDATTDFEQIDKWWRYNPKYNVALATGVSFDVIDVDPDKGGLASWAKLRVDPSLPDIHGRVITRSDGFHLYVEITGGGNRQGVAPGIDYRGRGGYVVAPPSQVPLIESDPTSQLKSYRWSVYPSPRIIPSRGGVVPQ